MSENCTVANRMLTAAALAICAAAASGSSALDVPETDLTVHVLVEIPSDADQGVDGASPRCHFRVAATDDRHAVVQVIREDGDFAVPSRPASASATGARDTGFTIAGAAAAATTPGGRLDCPERAGEQAAPAVGPVGVCVFVADVATAGDGSLCGSRLRPVPDAPPGD